MSYSNISATLTEKDMAVINDALTQIEQKLPFLINLSMNERKGLFKLGTKSLDFVEDAFAAAQNFPTILPATFDAEEFRKDSSLFKSMTSLTQRIDSLAEKVNDTLLAVGSEALNSSLFVYAYVQTASDSTPGLKNIAEKLKERFKRNPYKRTAAPVSNE
jgi:hypothetical protein